MLNILLMFLCVCIHLCKIEDCFASSNEIEKAPENPTIIPKKTVRFLVSSTGESIDQTITNPKKASLIMSPLLSFIRKSFYGGENADNLFQTRAFYAPYLICNNIMAGYAFSRLMSEMSAVRASIAREVGTQNPEYYQQSRADREESGAASLTSLAAYPVIRINLLENLRSLEQTDEWVTLDNVTEYRWRELSVLEWYKIIRTEHTDFNQKGAYFERFIKGAKGEGDGCTICSAEEIIGKDEDKSRPAYRYQRALLDAYKKMRDKIDVPELKIGLIECQYKDIDREIKLPSRGFIYVKDNESEHDFSDVPFGLLHPTTFVVNYYLGKVHQAFEDARFCSGSKEKKLEKINIFSYWFSITMPYLRGSASLNEWFTKALYLYHNLGLPDNKLVTKMDEIAQSSFTARQFIETLEELGINERVQPPFTLEQAITLFQNVKTRGDHMVELPNTGFRVVIARYNEDISWLKDHFRTQKVTIYNKGENDLNFDGFENIQVIPLENVGRESHTYLYDIVTNYESDTQDAVLFLQGRPFDHNGLNLLHITRQPTIKWPWYAHSIMGSQPNQVTKAMMLDEAKILLKENFQQTTWGSSTTFNDEYPSLEAFCDGYDIKWTEHFCLNYGANFMVKSASIKKRELSFYQRLLDSVSHSNAPIEGHYLERLWDLVFGKYTPPKKTLLLTFMQQPDSRPAIKAKDLTKQLNDYPSIQTVLVLSPYQRTGGPETLSFFCSEARKLGLDAYMLWWMGEDWLYKEESEEGTFLHYSPDKEYAPEGYKDKYEIHQLDHKVRLDETTLVVIPECWADAEEFFNTTRRLIYWLSIGNFENRSHTAIFQKLLTENKLNMVDCNHIVNTPWIEKYLMKAGITSYPMHDSISDNYRRFDLSKISDISKIERSIAYAPRKGATLSKRFMERYPDYHYVRIDGLSEEGVIDALQSAQIFLDFGHAPGIERMPRESVMCGCIPFVLNVGCAADRDAYPIDDFYRFEKEDIENDTLKLKIDAIFDHFNEKQREFDPYRVKIMHEPDVFKHQIKDLFDTINSISALEDAAL